MENKFIKKLKIPNKPGVYFFRKGKDVLYIGKATSLRSRVRSYFGKDLIETRGPLLVDMLFHASKIDWQVADSVLEALILEARLIKKHQPKYNTKEKDDKSFLCVVITKEKLPRVFIVRTRNLKEHSNIINNVIISKIYGPFTNGSQLKEALKILRKVFPFLDDKSKNYLEFYKQINLVQDLDDRKMYLQNIKNIKLFFEGGKKQIFKNLEKEMKAYAKNKEFEKAGEIKRQLFALKHINDVALIKNNDYGGGNFSSGPRFSSATTSARPFRKVSSACIVRIEAYDVAHMSGKNMVGVMTVVENNNVNKSEYKKFKIRTQSGSNDVGALTEILSRRFSHIEWAFPDLVVVDGGVAQLNGAKKVLVKMGIKIPVVSVVKDDRHKAKAIMGDEGIIKINKSAILLANSEAHRFAIAYHKNMRGRNFLRKF